MTLGSKFVGATKTAALSAFLFASLDAVAAPSETTLGAACTAATNDLQRANVSAYAARCGVTLSSSGASVKFAL